MFERLKATDTPVRDCGTFGYDQGLEPTSANLWFFMTFDRDLYLRTSKGVKKMELAGLEKTMKDPDLLQKGDRLVLRFADKKGNSATLEGPVVEAVIDEAGNYPAIEFVFSMEFKSKGRKPIRKSSLSAYDACL